MVVYASYIKYVGAREMIREGYYEDTIFVLDDTSLDGHAI